MTLEEMIVIPADPHAGDVDAMFECLVAELEGSSPFLNAVERLVALDREEAQRFAERAVLYAGLIAQNLEEQGPRASYDLAFRSLTAELAISARVSDRTIQSRLSEALALVGDFPLTLHALERAELSVAHARVIMAAGAPISDPARRADYESAVIARAASVTPGRLRRLARLAAERIAEVGFAERHDAAKAERAVRSYELSDGMSEVVATVPTVLAAGIMDRLTAMATAVRKANPDDPRHLDQIRADLLCELQLAGDPTGDVHAAAAGIHAEVAIVIPALTLLGKGDEPGVLEWTTPHGIVVVDRPDTPVRFADGAAVIG